MICCERSSNFNGDRKLHGCEKLHDSVEIVRGSPRILWCVFFDETAVTAAVNGAANLPYVSAAANALRSGAD